MGVCLLHLILVVPTENPYFILGIMFPEARTLYFAPFCRFTLNSETLVAQFPPFHDWTIT